MLRVVRRASMLLTLLVLPLGFATPVLADESLSFVAPTTLDVFVVDPVNGQGYRPARPNDDPISALFDAKGNPIALTFAKWAHATGSTERFPAGDGVAPRFRFSFTNLVPFGLYSIFVEHASPDGMNFVPFSDRAVSLLASEEGTLDLTTRVGFPLAPNDTIVLLYHSDGQTPTSVTNADLGQTVHEQLLLAPSLPAPDSAETEPKF